MSLLGRRKVRAARSQLVPLPADDPTGLALAELIDVPSGERYWPSLDAIDWQMRMVPGTPRAVCERGLLATSHRLLVMRRGGIEAIDYATCEPFGYRRFGAQGFIRAADLNRSWEFSAQWAAARAFVNLLNELRGLSRAS